MQFLIVSTNKMISAKKLIKLARKWRNLVAIRRKRITFPSSSSNSKKNSSRTVAPVEKGHFAVYSADSRRFVLPLEYLQNDAIRELFILAEEEYGLPSNERLTLPCNAAFIEYVISLIDGHITKDMERALLMSLASNNCSSSVHNQETTAEHLLICNC